MSSRRSADSSSLSADGNFGTADAAVMVDLPGGRTRTPGDKLGLDSRVKLAAWVANEARARTN